MATVNQLYGTGSFAALRLAFRPPLLSGLSHDVTEEPLADGLGARVWVRYLDGTKPVGLAKLDLWAGQSFWRTLHLEDGYRTRGLLVDIVSRVGDWHGNRNIQTCRLSPGDAWARWVFRRTGAELVGDGSGDVAYLNIGQATSRRAQYAAWKAGTAPEPDWHIALAAEQPASTGGLDESS